MAKKVQIEEELKTRTMNDDQKGELVYMGRNDKGQPVVAFIGKREMTEEDILKTREIMDSHQIMQGN